MTTNKNREEINRGKNTKEDSVQAQVLEKLGLKPIKLTKAGRVLNLVQRCKEGDQEAFRRLFNEFAAGVHRHLSLLIGPGPDIDDLVQLVFLNVFNSIKRFRGQSAFSTWLFRITVNVARQEIRLKGRHRRLGSAICEINRVQAPITDSTPEHKLYVQQQIYGVLNNINIKKRETFILYTYEGYSLEEIAELLDSSVSTIGSRLQSARREIVRILARRRTK
jgi:RNA polymerase sigma-70 factor (ECF subfamily)